MSEIRDRFKRSHETELDPSEIQWARHHRPYNEERVQQYMKNPNMRLSAAAGGDGDAFVIRRADGTYFGINGRHRAEAASRKGRALTVRVDDKDYRDAGGEPPKKESIWTKKWW